MERLFRVLKNDKSYREVLSCREHGKSALVYGASGSAKHALIASVYREDPRMTLVVTSAGEGLRQMADDLGALLPEVQIEVLPAADLIMADGLTKNSTLTARRQAIFSAMVRGEKIIVLADTEASSQKVLPRQAFADSRLVIREGDIIERKQLAEMLVKAGYEHSARVEGAGEFCVRGGIIDVYPTHRKNPYRIEFFDDEIDSIRMFDAETQCSLKSVEEVEVIPRTVVTGAPIDPLFSYLADDAHLIIDETSRLAEELKKLRHESVEQAERLSAWDEWLAEAEKHAPLYLSLMMQKGMGHLDALIGITSRGIAPYHKQVDLFYDDVREWLASGWQTALFVTNEDKARGIMRSLHEAGISAVLANRGSAWHEDKVLVFFGALSQGFEVPAAKLAVISERDILGQQKKRARPQPPKGKRIAVFRDINVGDYVVHNSHGIGKYVGVETITVAGVARDYLHIRYAGDDKLYVPTEQVASLQKYIGNEGDAPKLSRMGGADWIRAKTRARKAVVDIAKELVSLYAERKIKRGIAFDEDTPWQREFEDAFPYEETADQRRAIEEIKRDMERPQPMDRLLCGDVGFGKTEVAVRAAFKAVVGGKQVAVLVPTTVLAQQHYQTFASRCEEFGVRVGVINRFRSAKEQKETLKRVEEGKIDILVGTHRLLNSEIRFRDLGLLVVDEEQRFGVSQKEKMKQMSVGIDVLTLSATPIPRTLHMSLVGARDMSVIETPPEERYPVETYVLEYQESILRSAIRRELKRGGQVYFVYNRVETIDKMRAELERMMPDARIQTAHGQMAEELLEQVMLDFYEGKSDILISTSIIENGLDVPNANTIIVYDADHFGLSQLYQMRGRVGRSKRTSFAYFTYRPGKVLTEVAAKRLAAIREFTRLGAGFKIAMRDLEIRGAGNLLGAQQHGHIAGVGFEMYCHMLDEEIRRLKNEDLPVPEEETSVDIAIEAYLPESYVAEASYKMELYQRLAALQTEQDLSDLTDEMIDRFGDVPDETASLLAVTSLRIQARALGIRSIAESPTGLTVTFGDKPNVAPENVIALKQACGRAVSILPGPPPTIRLAYKKKDGVHTLKQAKTLIAMLSKPSAEK